MKPETGKTSALRAAKWPWAYQAVILLASAVLIGLDQLTKQWAKTALQSKPPVTLIDGGFQWTYHENTGIAWGMFKDQRWIVVAFTGAVLLAFLGVLLSGKLRESRFVTAGGILVAAGGLGNLIDRIWQGYVVDFAEITLFSFPVFNLADCCVVIGAIIILIYFFFIQTDDKSTAVNQPVKEAAYDDRDTLSDGGQGGGPA